ncbi:hypothetical protein FRC02_008724 [Tulasnella sp. 418]|nr:hypothetical protein FRC02_008724 [Tulasnella sp. 418]
MSLLSRSLKSLVNPATRPFVSQSLIRLSSSSAGIPATKSEDGNQIIIKEPGHIPTADIVSGAPAELRHRPVRIYQQTRNTMQSGGTKGEMWRIDFDILQGGGRWENPLMGWASSADYMQGTNIKFKTKEDAIYFAEKQGRIRGLLMPHTSNLTAIYFTGWDYYIQQPTVKRVPPKNYSENYTYKPGKLRICRTK